MSLCGGSEVPADTTMAERTTKVDTLCAWYLAGSNRNESRHFLKKENHMINGSSISPQLLIKKAPQLVDLQGQFFSGGEGIRTPVQT